MKQSVLPFDPDAVTNFEVIADANYWTRMHYIPKNYAQAVEMFATIRDEGRRVEMFVNLKDGNSLKLHAANMEKGS